MYFICTLVVFLFVSISFLWYHRVICFSIHTFFFSICFSIGAFLLPPLFLLERFPDSGLFYPTCLLLYLFPLEYFSDSGLFYPTRLLPSLFPLEQFPDSGLFYPTSLLFYLSPLEQFPVSGLFYPTSSLLYLLPLEFFPYSKLFYPTSHPQMRKFPNSSKILHKWFVLTNFCVIITTAINQIYKTSIKASENTLDKPVLHVYFIYEHIFICFRV